MGYINRPFLKNRRGIIHLLPFVIIAAILLVVGYLVFGKVLKGKLPFLKSEPKVALKQEYKNPFDKNTQYANPFDSFKNPFEVAK